jgi:hypothetical protein
MQQNFIKKGKVFGKMKFGHFFCPFLNFPKKSWNKKTCKI